MLPNFVIIGAQKSASSFMQVCLDDHPDIYLPPGEIPFFESPDYEHSSMAQLEGLFEGHNERSLGIKRPNYMGRPEVPARIREHLPEAQLLAVLRNPVDRALSAYFHYIKYGFIPPLDVEIGMRKLILSEDSFLSRYKRASEIIEFGYYHKHLSRYHQYKEDGKLLIFLHEEIISNPLASVQQAYQFLGVADDFIPPSLDSRPQQVLYNVSRLKLVSRRNQFLYNYNEDRTRLTRKAMTPQDKIASKALSVLDRKVLSRFLPNKKPKISTELRSMLNDLYAADIAALSQFLDKDLSAWTV